MRIGRAITNPGQLNTQVTLQSATVTKAADGTERNGWADLTPPTVWVRWTNAHGMELLQAQTVHVDAPATVLMRYRADLNTSCRIMKGSDAYRITSIDDIDDRHEYMELSCVLTKGGNQ